MSWRGHKRVTSYWGGALQVASNYDQGIATGNAVVDLQSANIPRGNDGSSNWNDLPIRCLCLEASRASERGQAIVTRISQMHL